MTAVMTIGTGGTLNVEGTYNLNGPYPLVIDGNMNITGSLGLVQPTEMPVTISSIDVTLNNGSVLTINTEDANVAVLTISSADTNSEVQYTYDDDQAIKEVVTGDYGYSDSWREVEAKTYGTDLSIAKLNISGAATTLDLSGALTVANGGSGTGGKHQFDW